MYLQSISNCELHTYKAKLFTPLNIVSRNLPPPHIHRGDESKTAAEGRWVFVHRQQIGKDHFAYHGLPHRILVKWQPHNIIERYQWPLGDFENPLTLCCPSPTSTSSSSWSSSSWQGFGVMPCHTTDSML